MWTRYASSSEPLPDPTPSANSAPELTEIQPSRAAPTKTVNVELACLLCTRLLGEWHQISEHDAQRLLARVTLRRVRCAVCGGPPVVAEITEARRPEPRLEASVFRVRPGRPRKREQKTGADPASRRSQSTRRRSAAGWRQVLISALGRQMAALTRYITLASNRVQLFTHRLLPRRPAISRRTTASQRASYADCSGSAPPSLPNAIDLGVRIGLVTTTTPAVGSRSRSGCAVAEA